MSIVLGFWLDSVDCLYCDMEWVINISQLQPFVADLCILSVLFICLLNKQAFFSNFILKGNGQ